MVNRIMMVKMEMTIRSNKEISRRRQKTPLIPHYAFCRRRIAALGIQYERDMPRTIRELLCDLEKAGFKNRGGKGSHRNYEHPSGTWITISGKLGDDAESYQEREVKQNIGEDKH